MENKLLILLKNLKIESQANILKEGKISKVVVARDNSYTFHLVFNQILPFEEYQLLINNRDNFPYPTKYKISYETEFFNQNELLLYTGYLLEKLKKEGVTVTEVDFDEFRKAAEPFYQDKTLLNKWSEGLVEKINSIID